MGWNSRKKLSAALLTVLGIMAATLSVSLFYSVEPVDLPMVAAKTVGTPLLARVYRQDAERARQTVAHYYVGAAECSDSEPFASWNKLVSRSGMLKVSDGNGLHPLQKEIPFVYDSPDAPPLRELRAKYRLGAYPRMGAGEYGQMLALAAWIGSRWDHGVDPAPGDGGVSKPADVIAAGENGAKFWCEIAARVTVQAATSVGWPARLVTASSDGYNWHHALAEIWSNQFNKWILVDTDYNILYESDGVPLSAYELCHRGPALREQGRLQVVRFAPLKQSLKKVDLLHLYRYVHIDLRNDWVSRPLRPGSPAGGDLATWWTARPDMGHLLTAKERVDDQDRFDWRVNAIEIHALGLERRPDGTCQLSIGLRGYSPYFKGFEVRLDNGEWQRADNGRWENVLKAGNHLIQARIVTGNGGPGPVYQVAFSIQNPS